MYPSKTLLQLSCLTHHSVALMFGIKYFSFKYVLYLILMLLFFDIPGEFCQESQFDISFLPPTKAHPAILFVHTLLHHSPPDHVPARSSATSLGCLLCSRNHVYIEYSPSTTINPIYSSLPSF